jgi:CBS domain-containing protein
MAKARDIMTSGIQHLNLDDTATAAARCLAETGVGAVPVCDADGRLTAMVTDRDLVLRVLAEGKDPGEITLGQLADQVEVVTIGADDDVEEAIATMAEHGVRRLPVVDGHSVVGMLSQADVAVHCSPEQAGRLVGAISEAP